MAVYYARQRGTNLVKIGYAKTDVAARVKDLQIGCPTDLELLATEDGDRRTERDRHREFAADQFRNEWFRMSGPIAARVALCDPEFARLADLEPGLVALARDIGGVGGGPAADTDFCAMAAWYGYDRPGFKDRMVKLVGRHREGADVRPDIPSLRTSDAYDVAYETLVSLLPDCGRCSCWRPGE